MSIKSYTLRTRLIVAALLVVAAEIVVAGDLVIARAPAASDPTIERWKLALSIIGYAGALIAFMVGLRQYLRAEYWKRSQFLAEEMKGFFADPRVENARTMIDWGARNIPLLRPSESVDGKKDSGERTVDRQLQCNALRPHDWSDSSPTVDGTSSDQAATMTASSDEVMTKAPSSDVAMSTVPSSDIVRKPGAPILAGTAFEPEEAAIRDCYDRFLDGFERFGNYLRGKLVSVDDLKPYIQYWIDDIADKKCDASDSLWCVFLFAYIEFYAFVGVQALFDAFGHDIRIDGALVKCFVDKCTDKPRAVRLLDHVRKTKSLAREGAI